MGVVCLDTAWSGAINRIVGGSDVDIKQVPYMLSFMLFGIHACGACILNENWGLTAAHCVTAVRRDPLRAITIRSGSGRRDQGGVVHKVRLVWIHEQYDSRDTDYDIAVFRVEPPFRMDVTTQPAKLPWNYSAVDTSWGLVAGWGYFLISRLSCVNDYKYRFSLTRTQVCYGFQAGGKDSCKGDSGGPLVNKQGVVIGITSWGAGCGEPYSPGVYTNVPLLRKWVLRKIKS